VKTILSIGVIALSLALQNAAYAQAYAAEGCPSDMSIYAEPSQEEVCGPVPEICKGNNCESAHEAHRRHQQCRIQYYKDDKERKEHNALVRRCTGEQKSQAVPFKPSLKSALEDAKTKNAANTSSSFTRQQEQIRQEGKIYIEGEQKKYSDEVETQQRRAWEAREEKRRQEYVQNAVAQCRQQNSHCMNRICPLEPSLYNGCARMCQADMRACMAYAYGLSEEEKQRALDDSENARTALRGNMNRRKRELAREAREAREAAEAAVEAAESYYSVPSFNYGSRTTSPSRGSNPVLRASPPPPPPRRVFGPSRPCQQSPGGGSCGVQ
jgi:hypothetical protein